MNREDGNERKYSINTPKNIFYLTDYQPLNTLQFILMTTLNLYAI